MDLIGDIPTSISNDSKEFWLRSLYDSRYSICWHIPTAQYHASKLALLWLYRVIFCFRMVIWILPSRQYNSLSLRSISSCFNISSRLVSLPSRRISKYFAFVVSSICILFLNISGHFHFLIWKLCVATSSRLFLFSSYYPVFKKMEVILQVVGCYLRIYICSHYNSIICESPRHCIVHYRKVGGINKIQIWTKYTNLWYTSLDWRLHR